MFHHKRQGSVDIISVKGPLHADVIDEANEFLEPRMNQGVPRLVFDLTGMPLIDSAGLEFLLDLQDRCAEKSGEFQLSSPTELCRDALRITGVDERFEIFDDVTSAVGSFSR